MFEKAIEEIKNAEVITIFRHIRPDGDAYGSQWGLATFLKQQFPEKRVYCLGDNNGSLAHMFPEPDTVSDETVQSSLAILCDTSTMDRCSDKRAFSARKIIKVDHHPNNDAFGDLQFVYPEISSCSEIVAMLIDEMKPVETIGEAAKYLYTGINTDTQKYTIGSVTADTLYMASRLARNGIRFSELDYQIGKTSRSKFQLSAEFRNSIQFTDNHLAYGYVTEELRQKYGVTYNETKSFTDEFRSIEGVEVWVLFMEDDEGNMGLFNGSIRSRGPIINGVAEKYNGGGHELASGVNSLTEEQQKNLLKDLDAVITAYHSNH